MSDGDRIERLERLNRLRMDGALSASEFEAEKRAILAVATATVQGGKTGARYNGRAIVAAIALLVLVAALLALWLMSPGDSRTDADEPTSATQPLADPASPANVVAADISNSAAPALPPPRPPALQRVDLSPYAGKYAFDRVGGVAFLSHPSVRSAVAHAAPNRAIRRWVLSSATSGPIDINGDELLYWGCEPHNCGSHNWGIVIERDGRSARICYYNVETADPGPNWYPRFGGVSSDQEGCPHEF
ncbi:MAG TPA: hypothetical protein VF693_00150 [Allosphingosinicella sp.]|jgi:hypothetical protein